MNLLNRIIVLSKKRLCGKKRSFKYFISYISKAKVFSIPLCLKLPQMNRYVKYFDSNHKYINFLFHDKELLKKYNEIWDKISNLLKKQFQSGPVHDYKFIRTKIKIYKDKINANFQVNDIPEDNKCCVCLFVIS